MIALSILFLFIIGLMIVVVILILKYSKLHASLKKVETQHLSEVCNHQNMQKKIYESLESEQALNRFIDEKILEMNQLFSIQITQENTDHNIETFTENLQLLMHSSLNLIKVKS